MQKYSDAELVALYIESKGPEFLTELFTRHSDIVYRTALRIMKNPSDAEDILQTVYCKLITNLHLYKGTGSVIGWMLQVVIHTCYNQLNSEKSRLNREKKIMSERVQMTSPKNNELKEMLENHLNKLPEIYKAPITLQIMEGLSIKEVSEALEIPEKTIRSQIARGLEKLKVSLQSVGVTASVVSIGDMLKEIQQPLAPAAIKSSQYFNSIIQGKTAVSAKIAVASGTKGFLASKAIAISMLAILSVSAIFIWNSKREKTSTLVSNQIIIQKWDFENANDLALYHDLGLSTGTISIEESKDLKKSKVLSIEEDTTIELDISKFQLPIKISYIADYFVTAKLLDNTLHLLIKGNYIKNQDVIFFSDLNEHDLIPPLSNDANGEFRGKWFSYSYYIDENNIDYWVEGKRRHFLKERSVDNKKVYLYFKGKVKIDDLIIEPIAKNSLPNKTDIETILTENSNIEKGKKHFIENEKWGINKNKFNPYFVISNPDTFLNTVGFQNEPIYPRLSQSNQVEWVKQRQKVSKKWDFENTKELAQYRELGLMNGSIEIVEKAGVENSKGLDVSANALIELDISKFQMPLKLSYSFYLNKFEPGNGKGPLVFKGNYLADKKILYFVDLQESVKNITLNFDAPNDEKGKWFHYAIYITEDYVDKWFMGNRSHIIWGRSKDNSKIYMGGRDKFVLDSLVAETIDKKDLPDVSIFEKLAPTITYDARPEAYPLTKEMVGMKASSEQSPNLFVLNKEALEDSFSVNQKVIYSKIGASGNVEWIKTREKVNKKFEFETSSDFAEFKVVAGKSKVLKNRGENKSDCIAIDAWSVHEIDISTYKLPLKITFSFDCILPPGVTGKGIVVAKGNYRPDQNIFNFSSLQTSKIIDVSEGAKKDKNENAKDGYVGVWNTRTIYVSEDGIDIWFDGKRSGVLLGTSIDNKKIYLYDLDQTLMDNFVITSIEPETVPDFSIFKKFADTIPFEKGGRTIPLAEDKAKLNIDKNSPVLLGIYDKFYMESALGLNKK